MYDRRTVLKGVGAAGASALLGGCTAIGGSDEPADLEPRDPEFAEVATEVGLDFETTEFSLGNGAGGVFVGDVTGDLREDVLAIGPTEAVLYENVGGEFERSDALPEFDPEFEPRTAAFFDHDNSGLDDLLLVPWEGRPAFLENVGGEFERRSAGFDVELQLGMGVTVADFFGDGHPDVFLIQNGDWREASPAHGVNAAPDEDNGLSNYLFRGDGDGFTRVEAPTAGEDRWSVATSAVDFTGNGLPDVHVANDFNHDVLYRNQGDGEFEAVDLPETDRHGMASATGDVTVDGRIDLFVTNIRFDDPSEIFETKGSLNIDNRGNNLLINEGDGEFVDRAEEFGVADGGWGWGATFADVTNDGHLDLAQATRYYREQADPGYDRVESYPKFWRGTDDGFEAIDGAEVGFAPTDGRGMALLDFDVDGRADVVSGNNNGPFRLYENRTDAHNWLQVAVRASGDHTPLGTEVAVTAAGRTQVRMRDARTDFLSQGSRILHFGVREAEVVDLVELTWPDGTDLALEDVEANQRIAISPDGIEERLAPDADEE